MEEQQVKKIGGKYGVGGIFIPAGLFIGIGIGMLTGNVAPGVMIGLGAGFTLLGITYLMKK